MNRKAYISPTMHIVELNQQYSILGGVSGGGKAVTGVSNYSSDGFVFNSEDIGDDEDR